MARDLYIRRLVPSTSRLTYNPIARRALDLADIPARAWFREMRSLPPNHLRIRVGVGNRIFANQVMYLRQGTSAWMYWLAQGWVDLDSDIVELGVGCGRRAHLMRSLAYHGEGFTGTYLGVDIDAEALAWCRANFDERFEFAQSTHASTSYVNDAAAEAPYRLPRGDASVDFIFAGSVFSHLLEGPARDYLEEGARVLRPGRRMAVTCFCKDLPSRKRGRRHTFEHRVGAAYVESLKQPTAAVAYESAVIRQMALDAGFASAEIMHSPNDVQQTLVCTQPER